MEDCRKSVCGTSSQYHRALYTPKTLSNASSFHRLKQVQTICDVLVRKSKINIENEIVPGKWKKKYTVALYSEISYSVWILCYLYRPCNVYANGLIVSFNSRIDWMMWTFYLHLWTKCSIINIEPKLCCLLLAHWIPLNFQKGIPSITSEALSTCILIFQLILRRLWSSNWPLNRMLCIEN